MNLKHLIFGAGLVALCIYGALHPAPHTAAPAPVKAAQIGDRVHFAHRTTSCNDRMGFDYRHSSAERSAFCQGWVDADTYGMVEEIDNEHYCIDTDGYGRSSCHWFNRDSFNVIPNKGREKL